MKGRFKILPFAETLAASALMVFVIWKTGHWWYLAVVTSFSVLLMLRSPLSMRLSRRWYHRHIKSEAITLASLHIVATPEVQYFRYSLFYVRLIAFVAVYKCFATAISIKKSPKQSLASIPRNWHRHYVSRSLLDPIEVLPGIRRFPIVASAINVIQYKPLTILDGMLLVGFISIATTIFFVTHLAVISSSRETSTILMAVALVIAVLLIALLPSIRRLQMSMSKINDINHKSLILVAILLLIGSFFVAMNLAVVVHVTSPVKQGIDWLLVAVFALDMILLYAWSSTYSLRSGYGVSGYGRQSVVGLGVLLSWWYRWSVKSTFLIWSPLIYLTQDSFSSKHPINVSLAILLGSYSEQLRRGYAIVVGSLLLVKYITLFVAQETLAVFALDVSEKVGAVPGFFLRPMEVCLWQIAAMISAAITLSIWLYSNKEKIRRDNGGGMPDATVASHLETMDKARALLSVYTTACFVWLVISFAKNLEPFPVHWRVVP